MPSSPALASFSHFRPRIFDWFIAISLLFRALPALAAENGALGATKAAFATGTSIADFGAVGDGTTPNTARIQSAIDQLAAKGGGTLVIPKGLFLSGAIFLKPGVSLHLEEGA